MDLFNDGDWGSKFAMAVAILVCLMLAVFFVVGLFSTLLGIHADEVLGSVMRGNTRCWVLVYNNRIVLATERECYFTNGTSIMDTTECEALVRKAQFNSEAGHVFHTYTMSDVMRCDIKTLKARRSAAEPAQAQS